jgi:hypothetical protein
MSKPILSKTSLALILNLLLPGSGYIYLKAKKRLWVAIPLLLLAIYEIGYICFVFFTNSHYPYDRNLSPFTSTGMVNINVYSWFVLLIMSIDTWDIARKFDLKQQDKKTRRVARAAS